MNPWICILWGCLLVVFLTRGKGRGCYERKIYIYLLASLVLLLHIQMYKFTPRVLRKNCSVRGCGAFGKAWLLVASAVRIWCCEKWFTQFPKGAAFQHVTTSWQHLKGALRAWKAGVVTQRATVRGKKPFLVEYENTKIHILVFRAIRGWYSPRNWAHVSV